MNWATGIVKVAVGRIDYGDSFPFTERYEYTIVSFNEAGDQSTIPGTFVSLVDAKKSLHTLCGKITHLNSTICSKGKTIDLDGHLDPNQGDLLVTRSKLFWTNRKANAAKKKYDNLH